MQVIILNLYLLGSKIRKAFHLIYIFVLCNFPTAHKQIYTIISILHILYFRYYHINCEVFLDLSKAFNTIDLEAD